MKREVTILVLLICCFDAVNVLGQGRWQPVDAVNASTAAAIHKPLHYLTYSTNEAALKSQLFSLSKNPREGQIIELPMPDGTSRSFRVWHSPMMPDKLAAKYPELRTFTAEAVDNPNITAKLDFTKYGFHAIIFDGINISFIDPVDNSHSGNYMVHYKKDETRAPEERMKCAVNHKEPGGAGERMDVTQKVALRTSNGYELRTYRLALACDNLYAQAATGLANPTVADVLGKMMTSMNRINGVYEREFSITMNFVENEDTLIWNVATGGVNGVDPFAGIDDNADDCLNMNQTVCDSRIGNSNYDIGHVFTTGAGGLSQVGVACQQGMKAQSVTGQPVPVGDGFDIDYVAHEMGHEYGADHPFNSSAGNCGGDNLSPPTAYEPGSGSTIMAYAGICSPDDLQPHSDPYFHSVSLLQIQSYITTLGDVCAVKTPTNNKLVSLPPFTASYTIPYLTPFELTAPSATDTVADTSITYCWEQWNLGDAGQELVNTHAYGPIFRSYDPVTTTTRIFPKNSMVLSGVLSNAGTEDAEGEKAPDVARYLTFKLSLRDIYQGTGCFLVPDDSIHLDVINTGTGFAVTSQGNAGITYSGNTMQEVNWNVVGTNTAPINTANVDIYLSIDGGNTWTYNLGTFPNTGSAKITLPFTDTTISSARLKVKGDNNVFFNVNKEDFTLIRNEEVKIFPVPANNILNIVIGDGTVATNGVNIARVVIYNSIGQIAWQGDINGTLNLPVSTWGRGIYLVRSMNSYNQFTTKKVVLE